MSTIHCNGRRTKKSCRTCDEMFVIYEAVHLTKPPREPFELSLEAEPSFEQVRYPLAVLKEHTVHRKMDLPLMGSQVEQHILYAGNEVADVAEKHPNGFA